MRTPCYSCVIKHLSAAAALSDLQYSSSQKPDIYVLGNILEAASEIRATKWSIMAWLLKTVAYNYYRMPSIAIHYEYVLGLVSRASSENEECPLSYSQDGKTPTIREELLPGPEFSGPGYDAIEHDAVFSYCSHIAQAAVISDEVWQGYPAYWMSVIGHLAAAESRALIECPRAASSTGREHRRELAAIVREHRIAYDMSEGAHTIPYEPLMLAAFAGEDGPDGGTSLLVRDELIAGLSRYPSEDGSDDGKGGLVLTGDTRPG